MPLHEVEQVLKFKIYDEIYLENICFNFMEQLQAHSPLTQQQ